MDNWCAALSVIFPACTCVRDCYLDLTRPGRKFSWEILGLAGLVELVDFLCCESGSSWSAGTCRFLEVPIWDWLVSGRDRQYLCMYVGIRVPIFVVVVARLGCPIIFLIFCN